MSTYKLHERRAHNMSAEVMFCTLIAAFLFSCSMVPGITSIPVLSFYGWRVSAIFLIAAVSISRGRFILVFSSSAILVPYILMLSIYSIATQSDMVDIFYKNILLFLLISMIAPDSEQDTAVDVIFIFSKASFVMCLLGSFYILLNYQGINFNWELARHSKFELLKLAPFNTILFFLVLSLLYFEVSRKTTFLLWICVLLLSVLTATRTPLLAFAISIILLSFASLLKRSKLSSGIVFLGFLITFIGGMIGIVILSDDPNLNRFLAGRAALWVAAYNEWISNPIFGSTSLNVSSALLSVYSDLSFNFEWEIDSLLDLTKGGYHNLFMQTLAVYGVVGGFILIGSLGYIIVIAYEGGRRICIIFSLLLLVRSCFESEGGLFSNANSPMDYYAGICAMVVIALSRERNHNKKNVIQRNNTGAVA